MIYNSNEILALETRFRANLINSIGGFKSLNLIGTKSNQGNENLALFSSFFHIGANPALCGIIIRPSEPTENTLGNILSTKQFTINHLHPAMLKQAHQASAKYAPGFSEFKAVGLSPFYTNDIYAPFVAESNIKFACEFVQKTSIELNNTTMIIAKIIKLMVPAEYIMPDGFIDLEAAETLTCSGLDSYHTTQKITRLNYAKTDQRVREI